MKQTLVLAVALLAVAAFAQQASAHSLTRTSKVYVNSTGLIDLSELGRPSLTKFVSVSSWTSKATASIVDADTIQVTRTNRLWSIVILSYTAESVTANRTSNVTGKIIAIFPKSWHNSDRLFSGDKTIINPREDGIWCVTVPAVNGTIATVDTTLLNGNTSSCTKYFIKPKTWKPKPIVPNPTIANFTAVEVNGILSKWVTESFTPTTFTLNFTTKGDKFTKFPKTWTYSYTVTLPVEIEGVDTTGAPYEGVVFVTVTGVTKKIKGL